ncbi:MAG: hypothetical protein WC028_07205 [Candidatus Obscuribacterales bacterium]
MNGLSYGDNYGGDYGGNEYCLMQRLAQLRPTGCTFQWEFALSAQGAPIVVFLGLCP